MTLTRKDAVATGLTGPAVFVFLATRVLEIALIWAVTTFRHAKGPPGQPVAT